MHDGFVPSVWSCGLWSLSFCLINYWRGKVQIPAARLQGEERDSPHSGTVPAFGLHDRKLTTFHDELQNRKSMRVLVLDKPETVRLELERIGVDNGAFEILADRSETLVLKLYGLSCAQANVLKQLALTNGGDCAIHRDVIKGEKKISDAILFINRRQVNTVMQRMSEQNFLAEPLKQLKEGLEQYERKSCWRFKDKILPMDRTYIMGVLNLTGDSFYRGSRFLEPQAAIDEALKMEEAGADFIDLGAESTRPGAEPISAADEMGRLESVLKKLVGKIGIPVSIDTYKADVARFAVEMGASIINDISAVSFDEAMIGVAAEHDVGLVLMHIKGTPKTMQENPTYRDLMEELDFDFQKKLAFVQEGGVDIERVVLDPGLGFGKRLEDNYTIMKRLSEFKILNRPILVGPSRKSFTGVPFGLGPEERLEGTLGLLGWLITQGANILRVHDVLEAKRVGQLLDLVLR